MLRAIVSAFEYCLDAIAEFVWPAKPQDGDRIALGLLAQEFHDVMLAAGRGRLGTPLVDIEYSDDVAAALTRILTDYRTERAQTPQERTLGRALDHVASTYLGI